MRISLIGVHSYSFHFVWQSNHDELQKRKSVFARALDSLSSVFVAKEKEPPIISNPFDFVHVTNVRPNPRSSTGFDVSSVSLIISAYLWTLWICVICLICLFAGIA